MTTKRNARPTAGAAGQAKQERHWASGNSYVNFTIGKGPISRYLLEGKENGLHLQDLVKITGWTEREVRQQIHRERRRHIPILSNNRDGYFLPGNPQERAICVCALCVTEPVRSWQPQKPSKGMTKLLRAR